MGSLHDPTTGFIPGFFLDRLRLFTPRSDVGGEAEGLEQGADFLIIVAFVLAHPLWLIRGRLRPLDRNALYRLFCHLEVHAVGAIHREADRNARSFGQET